MTRLVVFAAAWACGIVLIQAALFDPVWFWLALPVAMVVQAGWAETPWSRRAVWGLCGLLLGAGRMWLTTPDLSPPHIAAYNDIGQVTVTGIVMGEPDRRPLYTNLRVQAESLTLPNGRQIPATGLVLVKAPVYTPARYGDRVQCQGLLETPPAFESFSYRDYLARKGIHALLRRGDVRVVAERQCCPLRAGLFRFKEHALARLLAILPEPQASLLAGILLGVESGIPRDLNEAFVATGTSHIVAISGFNISIIAAIFMERLRLIFRKQEKVAVWLAVVSIGAYTVLVGAAAAVVRAAIMGATTIFAQYFGRRQHGPTTLAVAALLMMLLDPWVLWDVGFQLSFAATAGLIFYTDPLTRFFEKFFTGLFGERLAKGLVKAISEAFIVTLAAQITTTPLILAHFGRLSLVTMLTNFLILPVQAMVMIWGGLALLVALISLPLGRLAVWPAWAVLTYTIEVVRWTADFPLASVPIGDIAAPLLWGYYALLGLFTSWKDASLRMRARWFLRLKRVPFQTFVAGGSALLVLGAFLFSRPDGRLHIHILDVGQGQAIFIETPTGRQVLIDGSGDPPTMLSAVGRRMPFWDRQLDLVVLTAWDNECLAGLVPLLERYEVDAVAMPPGEEMRGTLYAQWARLLAARPAESTQLWQLGTRWQLDTDVTLEVLWPPAESVGPLVLQLRYRDVAILLPGLATTVVEETLVAQRGAQLASHVLLLPRHGAQTSTTLAFLQAVSPEVVVISVGRDNWAGEPAPVVLARVIDLPVYRTDRHGTLSIVSDGTSYQVHTERAGP